MALPSSGTISSSQIQTEFGISGAVPLNSLYRGGSYIANTVNNQGVPTSGQIAFNSLYGVANVFVYANTVSSNTLNYNVYSQAVSAGWNRTTPLFATITINTGVYVGSNTSTGYSFDVNLLPSLSEVYIVNNGFIAGAGGAGGDTANGIPGGTALRVQSANAWVTNNGTIAGGGGGGAGGLTIGYSSKSGTTFSGGGGGGGGQGYVGGRAGLGDTADGGQNGTAGSPSGPGAGGSGVPSSSGYGAAGGAYGASGGNSTYLTYPIQYGGAGGAAVVGNSNITWRATGTRIGSVS